MKKPHVCGSKLRAVVAVWHSLGMTVFALLWLVGLFGCSDRSSDSGSSDAARIPADSPLAAYLESIATNVAGAKSDSGPLLRLYDAQRAFSLALPDGTVAVSWGMLTLLSNEAEFACMIGHEIAHHRLGHVTREQAIDDARVLDANAWSGLTEHETKSEHEVDADREGLNLCVASGYDPIALPELLHALATIQSINTSSTSDAPIQVRTEQRINAALAHIKERNYSVGSLNTKAYSTALREHTSQQRSSGRSVRGDSVNAGNTASMSFFDSLDIGVLSPACLALYDDFDNDSGVFKEMKEESRKWSSQQCNSRNQLPSNHWDAFGHCFIACRITQVANEVCASRTGFARELYREAQDIFGGEDHDSFPEDVINQSLGRRLGREVDSVVLRESPAACASACSDAYDNGEFDLDAPERDFINCPAGDKQISMTAKCGETARKDHFFKNTTDREIHVSTHTESESLVVTPSMPTQVHPGATLKIDVARNCDCACNEDKKVLGEEFTVAARDNDNNVQSYKVSVNTGCRRVPEDCAGTGGDPHLRTFDGRRYDFQAAGEFLLARDATGDFEVQVRQAESGRSIARNSAIAMNVAGNRVVFFSEQTEGLHGLFIDGVETTQPDSPLPLASGGYLEPVQGSYRAVWPDGSNVTFSKGRFLNIAVRFRGDSMSGLLGNADGNRDDEPMTPGGERVDPREFDSIYGAFRSEWRVTRENSLFDYADGMTTDSYWNPDFPQQVMTLDSLTDEQRALGTRICTEASVPPSWFDDCVFDVGLTGDADYADNQGIELDLGARIDGPVTAFAGSEFEVPWSGPDSAKDFIAVADKESPAGTHLSWRNTRNGSPSILRAPDEPGDYELRYVQAKSRAILATGALTVEDVTARLQLPSEVAAGSEFEVSWQGPDNEQDFIAITEPGVEKGPSLNWKYTHNGTPLTLRAPDQPGDYEVRYVMRQSRQPLARENLTVTAVTARLQLPPEVAAGSEFEVSWQGPDNPQDFIAIMDRGVDKGPSLNWKRTKSGTPLTLRAPDQPGDYEVRYVMAQSRLPLVTELIEVTEVTADLQAPATVKAGESFEVRWQGPDNRQDFIAITERGVEKGPSLSWQRTHKGSPLTLTAPEEPGDYEIRYVMSQSRRALATRPLEVED